MSKQPPEKISIKPIRADLRVRKPNGELLKPDGEPVVWTAYWRRRELEGDIEREAPKEKAKASRVAAAKSTPPIAE